MVSRKEEVVISGIGGLYPEANNFEELKNLLFSKKNGVTIDSRRWDQSGRQADITSAGVGKMKSVDNFDAMFFKTNPKLALSMDILTKLDLERSVEAVIDAGLSPVELSGTNTGVFMCSSISETEVMFFNHNKKLDSALLGQSRAMQANRLSYILNLTGPSFSTDGGWICSSECLEKAKTMIENGFISSAIVGVANICLRPELQYQFQGLNRLNQGSCTKPFSINADGYNRSEACIVMFLQKASEAKRSYGTLLSVNSVQFGENPEHISEHDGIHFKSLLSDCYKKANVDPASVEYVEAYGSGIENEDSMELNAMEEVFCTERRTIPLKIGSVKSNVGHCEVSGLFMSIVKAVIALDSGYIPPNINCAKPNEKLAAIKSGKIQIVTEKTPLVGNIVGISSFGFSNAFSHVVLKRNSKAKRSFEDTENKDFIPRLVLASGRNEGNAIGAVSTIMKHGNDSEYMALTYEVFTKDISTHFHRCYSIFPSSRESQINDVAIVSPKKRPVWFIFSGMGSQWHGMGSHLMKFPIFADTIRQCDAILKPRGVDINYILTSLDKTVFDNILNSFVGIAAVQIGLVNMLNALDIVPDGIIGHSLGENGCAYADGCITAEEALLSAYARGRASLETDLIPGMMAAIGLGFRQIKDRLPHDVDVACHNSASSCTISGPVDSVNAFVSQLKSEGVFAKSVNVSGIAFHGRYIQPAGPAFHKYIREIIREPRLRSSKWISSSVPEAEWNSELAKYASAEYFANNLLSSVLFEEAIKHLPSDAVTIEIAPHGLLQGIIKKALPDTVSNISLTKNVYGESVQFLLNAIGKMYVCGLNPKVQRIYPKVTFPVSRETPSMSNLPLWDHTQQWSQRDILNKLMNSKYTEHFSSFVLADEIYLINYKIHGHHMIPPSFMLFDVWKLFGERKAKTIHNQLVQFQNLWFKNIKIHSTRSCNKYIMIQLASGLFEYNIDNEVVLSGQINYLDENKSNTNSIQPLKLDKTSDNYGGYVMNDELYSLFNKNGYSLGDSYKNIIKYGVFEKVTQGYVKWTNDWVYFIDGLLKFSLLEDLEMHKLSAPVSIREIKINPSIFNKYQEKDVRVSYNKTLNEINCIGVNISGVRNGSLLLPEIKSNIVKIEQKTFVHLNNPSCQNIDEFITDSMDIILEVDRFNIKNVNKKLILCIPYNYNDSILKACTNALKRIIEKQLSNKTLTLTRDNIKKTSEYDESGRFIMVTNVDNINDTINVLASKKSCYIIVYSKEKLQDFKNWKVIMQQKFDGISHLALIKKDSIFDKNNVFLKQNYSDNDVSICRTLDTCYITSTGITYIVSKSEPLEGIHDYVKNMLLKHKSQRLRFLFILDTNAPDFEFDKSFYKEQLIKGLTINIYKNGGWGYDKRCFVQDLIDEHNISENLILTNLTTNSEYIHSAKYLALNYKDLVVENCTKNRFGPLDYSGFAKNHKLYMGIASYEQKSSKIKYDSILSWPVPTTWSPKDATTVPLTYAMTYYVLYVLSSLRREHKILITSGLHPIGQAAIAIGLAEKCDIYAVVESSQDVELLSNIFPELPRSRIIVNTNNKFDIKLMLTTKSKGVDIVLNFENGEAFQAAFRTIAYHGKLFHFSKSDVKTNTNIGTRVFLRDTSFTMVSSTMLLNESDRNKQTVRLAFMDGLNKGVVKPFPIFDLTKSPKSRNVFDTMRAASTLAAPQKVVLSVSDFLVNSKSPDFSICDKYQCRHDEVYVIVGNKLDWLDVAEWLVDRGAQNIVIVVKRLLISSVHSRRFDRLLSRNLSIKVESDLHLTAKEESLNWLNRLTSFNDLGSMFIVNQADGNKINNLRYAFENNKNKSKSTSFVCISSNGEITCAELKSIGLKSLNVSWDKSSSQSINVSKTMVLLDTIIKNSQTTNSSSYILSKKSTGKSEWSQEMNEVMENFFPNSVDDVHDLNKVITKKAGFVEVQTMSPRFSHLKSVTPVFVVPGFRPKFFEPLYKQLIYPVFEARLPGHIESIDKLSNTLVEEVKSITKNGNVTLIGESWGGVVVLKMAQILEAQGTLVTVSLLNGDPKTVTSWAERLISNDCFAITLKEMNNNDSDEISKYVVQTNEESLRTAKSSVCEKSLEEYTTKSLNWIRSVLRTLLETKPFPNKLHTKVLMFNYERFAKPKKINDLIDYCDEHPSVRIVPGTTYEQMMTDRGIIEVLTNTVAYPFAAGKEISLSDKYKNFYFYHEALCKSLI